MEKNIIYTGLMKPKFVFDFLFYFLFQFNSNFFD